MGTLLAIMQIAIAGSVFFVWVTRLPNVEREFREYALPDVARNLVGASKIAAATLLVAGIWFPPLVVPSASVMAFFMLSAQFYHFKVRHPLSKYMASFALLLGSLFVVIASSRAIP